MGTYFIHDAELSAELGLTTTRQEAHKEMIQIYGGEKPDHEWILTDYDVWVKNPYFTGVPTNEHPEDDC